MSDADRPRRDRSHRSGGSLLPPDAVTLASIRALIREERRIAMRARTLCITLESALRDYADLESAPDDATRIALRRQWCERVLKMVQEARLNAMRNRHAFELIADEVRVGKSGTARFAAARREFEQHAGQAEEAAMREIGEAEAS